MTRTALRLALAAALVCAAAAPALAHKPSDAHVRLAIAGVRVTGRIDVAVRDLDAALAIDSDGDGAITWGELRAAAPRIDAYLRDRLTIAADGAPCELALGEPALVELSDGAYRATPIDARCEHAPTTLAVDYGLLFDIDAQHRGLVHVDGRGRPQVAHDGDTRLVFAPGESTSIVAFVREGILHIWSGLDHVLFLVCLLLPAVFPRRGPASSHGEASHSLRDVTVEVFEIVTAFTLAHSITLVVSAAGLLQLPSRYTETAIALSVVAAALNNLVRAIDARWAVAFALGLLHGFGFSATLVDLGLPSHELIGTLLGFNVGVEIGQAAIVLVVLPTLYLIRRTLAYQALLYAGSATVAVVAAVWSYQRWFV